ncbi:MAG: signal recognition particle-docking protein FtsY [Alphaproteobacteria bacterium]
MTNNPKTGFFSRLKQGLSRSSQKLTSNIAGIFTKKKLDKETLQELEEALIMADLGPACAARITAEFGKNRFGKEISEQEIKAILAQEISNILAPVAQPLTIAPAQKPFILLMVGVNGAGKTTTIGKLAHQWSKQGKKLLVVAGDTFRAAAVEQLKIWADRANVPVLMAAEGGDAAALAYQALEKAMAEQIDIVLIDTAGRLQNKANLMAELQKIIRVMQKLIPDAPHAVLQVLDATTGQNAVQQVEIFREMVGVTGLVLTKLDGSAKGGILVQLAEKFALPVPFIGVGETADDLQPFDAAEFAASLVDVE